MWIYRYGFFFTFLGWAIGNFISMPIYGLAFSAALERTIFQGLALAVLYFCHRDKPKQPNSCKTCDNCGKRRTKKFEGAVELS